MSVMYREPSIIKKSKDGRVAAVDMASELLNSRVLLLEGEVNDVTCNGLIKSMLVLEHQSAAEPVNATGDEQIEHDLEAYKREVVIR